jgi:hypothetical protein
VRLQWTAVDKNLPEVPGTGRHYLDRTRGGWLVSSPIERHVPVRHRGRLLLVAVALLALALALAFY